MVTKYGKVYYNDEVVAWVNCGAGGPDCDIWKMERKAGQTTERKVSSRSGAG